MGACACAAAGGDVVVGKGIVGEGRGAVVGVVDPFRREGRSRDRQETDKPEVQDMYKE